MADYDNYQVSICMATYQGVKYLDTQLDSILNQTFNNWHLYIRDDGSDDGTKNLIMKYVTNYPDKITDLSNIHGGGNSQKNFLTSLKWITENEKSDFYMLCDQDDFWLPTKIETTISRAVNRSQPILVHTDLTVVDENLETICESFMQYGRLNPQKRDLAHLLVQNNVTGCTMLWNRQLNDLINYDEGDNILMHDWWIALVAAGHGEVIFVPKQTMLYRQHKKNVVGAQRVGSWKYVINKIKNFSEIKIGINRTFEQAKYYQQTFKNSLPNTQLNILTEYLQVNKVSKFKKVFICLKYGFLKQSFFQRIAQLFFI